MTESREPKSAVMSPPERWIVLSNDGAWEDEIRTVVASSDLLMAKWRLEHGLVQWCTKKEDFRAKLKLALLDQAAPQLHVFHDMDPAEVRSWIKGTIDEAHVARLFVRMPSKEHGTRHLLESLAEPDQRSQAEWLYGRRSQLPAMAPPDSAKETFALEFENAFRQWADALRAAVGDDELDAMYGHGESWKSDAQISVADALPERPRPTRQRVVGTSVETSKSELDAVHAKTSWVIKPSREVCTWTFKHAHFSAVVSIDRRLVFGAEGTTLDVTATVSGSEPSRPLRLELFPGRRLPVLFALPAGDGESQFSLEGDDAFERDLIAGEAHLTFLDMAGADDH